VSEVGGLEIGPRGENRRHTRVHARDAHLPRYSTPATCSGGGRLSAQASKQGICLEDGTAIAFLRMLRVADLPRDWRHWSPAVKIEHLLGVSLDRAGQILCWSPLSLDPLRLSLWFEV